MNNSKVKNKQYIDKNPIESVRDSTSLASAINKSLTKDVARGMAVDFWHQFLGYGKNEKNSSYQKVEGELIEGQEVSFSNLKKDKERAKPNIEAGIDYRSEILHGEKRIRQKENQEITASIQQILSELKKLTASSKQLEVEFKEVRVEQRITKPGKYHVSLFQWILAVVKTARMKVEDSKAWLSTVKSKHTKKGFYWTNADEKVGGTSFSLSSERVVATQTG